MPRYNREALDVYWEMLFYDQSPPLSPAKNWAGMIWEGSTIPFISNDLAETVYHAIVGFLASCGAGLKLTAGRKY